MLGAAILNSFHNERDGTILIVPYAKYLGRIWLLNDVDCLHVTWRTWSAMSGFYFSIILCHLNGTLLVLTVYDINTDAY